MPPKLNRALRALCQHGEDALRQRISADGKWHKALVSKRKAAGIRKRAVIDGTFGTFNAETGVGWDPKWDRPGNIGKMLPPKNWTRTLERREERAQRIEAKLANMDKEIDNYYREKQASKPEPTHENYYKSFKMKR
mmetsp:Transcript_10890/g.16747  ORF Transcript_10890/g.16747 Transcript_10890/m.16747 type:complete len:136 (+) Transcript_10890:81-488(+)